ncbi:MAG: 23S rRNA (adenine(2030)-N(6))-methyltransferase RlmJ [Gammaproteobacteria bacterium]|nr:23S rRNA (adenine(2030)-N(6))-methyltransferase RlmJ [Gammaproteobacteria bacterium]
MNYRHEFHAGNFADVMKHALLVILLQALNRKPSAWCYFDTHAGAGCYDLKGKAALQTREASGGIGRLWPERSAAPLPIQKLCEIVSGFNPELAPDTAPHFYPGSPCIAAALARTQDRLVLAELLPHEQRLLRVRFHGNPRVAVHARDGYEMLKALVPPSERRGLVCMDPPFEKPDEFDALIEALTTACARWSTGVYALWYPIKDADVIHRFYRRLLGSGLPPMLVTEFRVAPAGTSLFTACGMLMVNPPWQCEADIDASLKYLVKALSQAQGSSLLRWLVTDKKQG